MVHNSLELHMIPLGRVVVVPRIFHGEFRVHAYMSVLLSHGGFNGQGEYSVGSFFCY